MQHSHKLLATACALALGAATDAHAQELKVLDPHRLLQIGKKQDYARLVESSGIRQNIGLDPCFLPQLAIDDEVVALIQAGGWGSFDVDGYTADGATLLLLAYHAAEEGCVEFLITDELGSIADKNDAGSLYDASDLAHVAESQLVMKLDTRSYTYFPAVGGMPMTEHWAFALLRAPANFVRTTSDQSLHHRPVEIEATFWRKQDCTSLVNPVLTPHKVLEVHRPPIVFLHGLQSNNQMWNASQWSLMTAPAFVGNVFLCEYDQQLTVAGKKLAGNAASFHLNQGVVAAHIQKIAGERTVAGIATTRADVVGHSMGGVLARIHGEGAHVFKNGAQSMFRNKRKQNYVIGDIHKLITLDSPLHGSQWANKVIALSMNPTAKAAMELAGKVLDMHPFDGAVEDLQENGYEMMHMLESRVHAHPLISTGGRDALDFATAAALDWIGAHLPIYMLPAAGQSMLSMLLLTPRDYINATIFSGQPHDLIVKQTSQAGGLTGANTSLNSFPAWEMTHSVYPQFDNPILCNGSTPCWVGVGNSSYWGNATNGVVKDLLNSRLEDPGTWAAAFPKYPPGMPAGSPPVPPPGGGGIEPEAHFFEIVTPYVGQHFAAGSSVQVVLRPLGGFQPASALVMFVGTLKQAVLDPSDGNFKATITVPLAALGTELVLATAIDAGNISDYESSSCSIDVPPGQSLVGMTVEPTGLELWNSSIDRDIKVDGQYTDVVRDITAPDTGTTYSSANAAIATVGVDGVVQPRSIGTTTITVSNAGITRQVTVNVHEKKGDADTDGDVDVADFGAFAACFTGASGAPGYVQTEGECAFTFDFDGDYDIDYDDYDAFKLVYQGPLGLDCNGNTIDDQLDILSGAVTDCDHNGKPDSVVCGGLDCNANGIADSCDIAPKTLGFDPALTTTGGWPSGAAGAIACGDFDANGKLDFAVCNPNSNGLYIAMGLTNGSYTITASSLGTLSTQRPRGIAAADFDANGRVDLAVAIDDPATSAQDKLAIITTIQFNGTFSTPVYRNFSNAIIQSGPRAVVVGQFNSDAFPDIAVARASNNPTANPHGSIDTFLNSAGTFPATGVATNAQNGTAALTAGDFDHDNDVDLVVANYDANSVQLLKNNGAGTFAAAGTRTTFNGATLGFASPVAVASGDLTGDGWPEVLIADASAAHLMRNRGINVGATPQFDVLPNVAALGAVKSVRSGDVDGDGRTDFVVARSDQAIASVVSVNTYGCTVEPTAGAIVRSYTLPTNAADVALADFDGDLDLDLVASSGTDSSLYRVLNHTLLPYSKDRDANAVPDECQVDCTGNGLLDTCDIAKGLAVDCDRNLVPDSCQSYNPSNDCNGNLVPDVCEIESGSLPDCNGNWIPDGCEIALGLTPDCNGNGIPDSCDIHMPTTLPSPQLGPFYSLHPVNHTFSSPPNAAPWTTVTLNFAANADFASSPSHQVDVKLNGAHIGYAYTGFYNGCNSPTGPDTFTLQISGAVFNTLKGSGNLNVSMTPPSSGMQNCPDPFGWIRVTLDYDSAICKDVNGNGVPDSCEGLPCQ